MLLSHGALHAGYHVCSSHGWFLSRIIELVYFHTEHRGESRMSISNFLFLSRDLSFGPTDQREVICESANFSSHGESRRSRSFHTSFLFVPNYRICELVYFHTEHRGESRSYCPEFANCRIGLSSHGFSFLSRIRELSNFCLHTEYRGQSRVSFLSRIFEFSNFIFLVPRLVLCPETCPWTH